MTNTNTKLQNCVMYKHGNFDVPLHFGFITKEAEDFTTGKGIVDLSFHRVYRISGKDRYTWLSKISSQTFIEHDLSYSKEALILSPQGHVLFALNVVVNSDCIYIIEQQDLPLDKIYSKFNENETEKGQRNKSINESCNTLNSVDNQNTQDELEYEDNSNPLQNFFTDTDLKNFLHKMIFMSDVIIEDISNGCEVIGITGDFDTSDFASVVEQNNIHSKVTLVAIWQDPWPNMGAKNATYYNVEYAKTLFENLPLDAYTSVYNTISDSSHPASKNKLSLCVFEKNNNVQNEQIHVNQQCKKGAETETSKATDLIGTLVFNCLAKKYSPCGILAFESWKISNYRPWGYTQENKILPHEVDWLRTAVQLNKGCYCGQETVARIVNVGKPPRRLVKLYIDGYMEEIPNKTDLIYVDNLGEKQQIGKVLNVANHYDEGYIALGLIKRNIDVDVVLVGNLSATCEEIVTAQGRCSASPNTDNIMDVRRNRLR